MTQPIASVTVAAVPALITFPTPGIHPHSTWDAVLPIVAAAALAPCCLRDSGIQRNSKHLCKQDRHPHLDRCDERVITSRHLRKPRSDRSCGNTCCVNDRITFQFLFVCHTQIPPVISLCYKFRHASVETPVFSLFSSFRSHPISCLDVSQLVIFILQYLLHCFWTFRLSVLHHLRYTNHSFLLWFLSQPCDHIVRRGLLIFGQIQISE